MKKTFIIVFIMFFALCGLPHITKGKGAPREYVQANQLFSQGRYTDAIRTYRSVLSSPTHSISPGLLYTRIADSYFRLTDYELALIAYRNALYNQKRDERAQTQYWIGFCTLLLGRNAEAVTELLKIPENYPDSGMWVGTAYYWAGRASERMGSKEQAVEFYRKAGGKGQSTQERFAIKKAKAVKKGSEGGSQ
jgi:tetratricopeptide (TPR) repeat protein